MSSLETEFLFQMRVKLAPPIDSGPTPNGHRMIFIGTEGIFKGPRLCGEVLPGSGGDWALLRPDGSIKLDVRLSLKTDDGAIIYMAYSGRLVAPKQDDLKYALDLAKPDDPDGASRYYFRVNPLFETGHERYTWLNHIVAVGTGRTGDGCVIYDIFVIQ